MKKIGLLIVSMLLLTSCTKYGYNIDYTTCNGNTGSVYTEILKQNGPPYINTYREAVPILQLNGPQRVLNVCEFQITNKTLLEK